MIIQPNFVNSATGCPGSPIFGTLSVFNLAKSPAPSIMCTGKRLFVSTSFITTPDKCGFLSITSRYFGFSRISSSPLSTLVTSTGIENFLFTSEMAIVASSTSLVDAPSNISIFRTSFLCPMLEMRSKRAADAYELPAPVSDKVRHLIPSTSTTTTGYVTFPVGIPVATRSGLAWFSCLWQMDVWCLRSQIWHLNLLLHSSAWCLVLVQLKHSFFSDRIFCLS